MEFLNFFKTNTKTLRARAPSYLSDNGVVINEIDTLQRSAANKGALSLDPESSYDEHLNERHNERLYERLKNQFLRSA